MATRNPYGLGGWWLEEREYAQLLAAGQAKEEAERERDRLREELACDDVLTQCCSHCDRTHHRICPKIAEERVREDFAELAAERDAATTALRAAEAKLADATRFCSGEFPCEASTSAASLERERNEERDARRAAEAEVVGLREALEALLAQEDDVAPSLSWDEARALAHAALTSSAPLAQAVVDRIAGEERERCAQVVDECLSDWSYGSDIAENVSIVLVNLAAAIRALPKREIG